MACQVKALLHRFANFGVRVGAGGEVSVRLFLLRHHGDMGDAQLSQQLFHAFKARTVQRSVDQLQVLDARAVAHTLGVNGIHEIIQTFLAAVFDAAFGQGCIKIGGLHGKAVHGFDGGQNLCGNFQRDLAAVRAVHLVAVVLGGVVAGGDADARAAAVVAHGPAQGRGGLQPGVDVGLDAVGGEDGGSLAGEHIALDAAVVADGNLLGQAGGVALRML